MENQKKQRIRESDIETDPREDDRRPTSRRDSIREQDQTRDEDFAPEFAPPGSDEDADRKMVTRREPVTNDQGLAITGYAVHALEAFDPDDPDEQLAEHYVFHDKELARYGSF